MAEKSRKVLQKKLSPEVYTELEEVVEKRWISEKRSLVEKERIKDQSWCCGGGGGARTAFLDFARPLPAS